ncbi:hypothetical protein PUN28_004673 [Cardiocondyla obscurior]|uniref:Uncharacterized protein n=2 Tax=Cardiocondyla obscurior TaxID=286306 RepID=A0AAW2GCM2_9HYME
MKTYRKLAATVPLLLIHLLTLQIGDAERDRANISIARNDPGIVLEEVIITGSGNNTRVIANAVAEDASQLDDEILSLLSKRETRRGERTDLDQDAVQSHTTVNANEEDDLEIMSRVIAKYEPQRLTSRKTKRKIVDSSNGTRGIHGKVVEPITDLERAYAEVLQNISRRTPELSANNAELKSYLSQTAKQLKQAHVPKVITRPVTNEGAEKSRSDSSLTFSALNKKSKGLPKKYLHLNRTASGFSSAEDSESGEKLFGGKASSTPAYKAFNGKAKSRNASGSTSNIYSGPAKKSNSRRKLNIQESIRDIDRFIAQLNNSNIIKGNNLKSLNVSNDAARLLPRYNVPRPFSVLQSPNTFVTSTDTSYRKPSSTPTGFNHQHQIARSSANVLPLVLPTDLFSLPPTRRYVPIKRVNHLEENSTTVVSTEASPTSPIGERTTLANYDALYTAIIGTTRSPLAAVNSQQNHGSSDYYTITDNPTERSVTRTNFAATYPPDQTSASYTAERQKDSPEIDDDVSSRITGYNDDERLNLNENPGVAHYNKFANLYSINMHNVFNTPKAIAQEFKQPVQPSQQQVSTLSYATLKPLAPTLLKVRPIISAQSTPYYDSRLVVSQDGQYSANGNKNDEINEQSRGEDKIGKDDNDNNGNYETQVDREAYKIYETPNKQREKKNREEKKEDRYPQQSRNYGFESKDKRYKYDKSGNSSSKNNARLEKSEDVRHENNDDEEEAEESEESEHVGIEKSKDEDSKIPRHQYNKYEYDTDDDNSDEKQYESPRYNHEKYNKPKDRRDKHDYEDNNEYQFNKPKYFESVHNDEDHENRSDKKKLINDKRYKKDQRDRKYKESEEESVAEDKPIFKDLGVYTSEERDDEQSSREEHATEKHEPNPTHTSEKYHPRPENDRYDYPRQDSENRDNDKESELDHVHGETQEHEHKHEEHHGKKGGDHHFEKGGGAEHEEEHHGHEGEKGKKGYKVWHEHEKAEKGHHDKEQASKHYDEKGGEEKKHDEEGGYHEEHNHGEGGKKTSEFAEKGKHKKGHTTHGEHSVHKKDEYEKKTEFFDEFHEDGDVEKHGGHHHNHELKKGGHEKKGHHDGADHEEKYGKEEKFEKGGHHDEHKGHKVEEGDDHHYDHDHKYGKKEGHERGKKWSFKKGDGGGDAGGDHKHDR